MIIAFVNNTLSITDGVETFRYCTSFTMLKNEYWS